VLDYSGLWELMEKNGVTQYYLLKYCGIDNKTLVNMKKNGNITLLTVEKIYKALNGKGIHCTLDDIVKFTD
jgi:DNA-binding Xre family transcriptional regulator